MMEASKGMGMITMDASIHNLFKDGVLTKEEAMRFMRNPKKIEKLSD
jgi:Tfp pilus assembly pilus retraction ATPase PilT